MGILEEIKTKRLLAIIRGETPQEALTLARLAHACGVPVEIALTTPRGIEAVKEAHLEGIALGVGTVLTPQQGEAAIEAGASFLVSPHTDAEILSLPIPVVPGVMTPTEIMQARRLGASLLKLFPAGTLGPHYLRMLRDPFPDLEILVTGGVHEATCCDYIQAGAKAVGLASALFPREEVREGALDRIKERLLRLAAILAPQVA